MTATYVALIRGINLGRAKRVAMADLRAAFERLGFGQVRTLLNSGNVVFTAPRGAKGAAARIEKAMAAELGVPARVLVLTADELDAVVTANRLTKIGTNPSRMFVGFLFDRAGELSPLAARKWGREVFATGPRAAYMWCPEGMIESPLVQAVGRAMGEDLTVRNWATVTKLHALVNAAGASEKPPAKKSPRQGRRKK